MLKRKKPGVTARYRAQRRRAEQPVIKSVRGACVKRDGYCRYAANAGTIDDCSGPSEWAHIGPMKRAHTMGMQPEERHTTAGTMMLCKRHHDQYDGRQKPRLLISALTEDGAEGPMFLRYGPKPLRSA